MSASPRVAISTAALVGLVLAATALVVGPGDTSIAEVATVLSAHLGGPDTDPTRDTIVWDLRLPRIGLATLVGGSLGAAGTVTQGLFRNPMAAPGVLGISAGAAAAAVFGFALGLDEAGIWATPLMAGLGAGVALGILFGLAGRAPGITTLLLSGVALGALFGAITTLILALEAQRWDLGVKVVRWLMGSFEGRSWGHLAIAVGPCALGVWLCVALRRPLDALQLGEETAATLGVDLVRTRAIAMVGVGLLVGTATAVAGVIGFIGLIVPHIARLLVGPAHRVLLPLAALLGATTLVAVDTLTRVTLPLPPGVITSLLGAPFFLWLLRRHVGGGFA